MKFSASIASILLAAVCSGGFSCGALAADAPRISHTTKFGGIDLLFTERVDQLAQAEGSDFQVAIREVGFELISAVGRAAKASPGVNAVLIDGIRTNEPKALVVLGLIADGKFSFLKAGGKPADPAVAGFLAGLEANHVASKASVDGAGLELSIKAD